MIPNNSEKVIAKSNAGRKPGSKNKSGSQKPGPKPKHMKNQQQIFVFMSRPPVSNDNVSAATASGSESTEAPMTVSDYDNTTDSNIIEEDVDITINANEDPDIMHDQENNLDSIVLAQPLEQDDDNINDTIPDIEELGAADTEEPPITELTDEEVRSIEESIASVPENGWLDNYLTSIQNDLKNCSSPKNYSNGKSYWINPGNASLALKGNIDPITLYLPRVFIWLPHHLTKRTLTCPTCKNNLSPMEWVKKTKARRIIDEENSFYLMSMRYKCTNNISKSRHTFMGYSAEVVRQLPLRYQADFPAVLTHKSGFSTPLMRSLRPLFQNGTGPHRMNQILRVRHTEVYDIAQLQYYDAVVELIEKRAKEAQLAGVKDFVDKKKYAEFSSFSDKDGYNGFIPSASYISYVYCSFITELRPYMNQHQSLLDGKILKGDHSFKIIKKMNKTNGVSDYSCMYTVMNEYEEIKMQVLAPTKSLKHIIPSFNNLIESYTKYGFEMPELFYTDNVVGDRSTLEEVIPSLMNNVKHIKPTITEEVQLNDEFTRLPLAKLPEGIDTLICDNSEEINSYCQSILDDVSDDAREPNIYIGFDCEWVYQGSRIPRQERINIRFLPVSLVQIAYKSAVYLFRIHNLHQNAFPEKLAKLITHRKIIKVGRGISGDLSRFRSFGITATRGELEIGTMCKDKGLTDNGRASLSKLCGEILGVHLPKVSNIRCGNWESPSLSVEQINYAALDAWVTLQLYNECKDLPTVNRRVNTFTPEGTFVSVNLVRGKKNSSVAAYGYVQTSNSRSSVHADKEKNRSNNFVAIKLVKKFIPGFVLDCYTSELTLHDFECNSTLLVDSAYLYTSSKKQFDDNCESHASVITSSSRTTIVNQTSSSALPISLPSQQTLPSRVLRDVFHVLDLIKVKLSHGMAKDFIRRLRDAFLVYDQKDKSNVENFLHSINSDWNTYLITNPEFIMKRVKRYIPPPNQLLPVVKFIFEKYGPLKCARTSLPLFDQEANRTAAQILKSIELGHISDPIDGPALYIEKGLDSHGLMVYKCSRGTNSVEGSCHMNVIRRFASYNASTRLTDAILADYRLYHNINVGAVNRYGKKSYNHHYSPWISLSVNLLREKAGHTLIHNYFMDRVSLFMSCEHTSETFGIVKFPLAVMNEYRILSNNILDNRPSRLNLDHILTLSSLPLVSVPNIGYSIIKFAYKYLAKCQGTKYAVTAVHTKEEIDLFNRLLRTQGSSNSKIYYPVDADHPDFSRFAAEWNYTFCAESETNNIYYKTPEHLRAYYNIIEDRKKYGNSVLQNWEESRDARTVVEDNSRLNNVIISVNPRRESPINQGLLAHITPLPLTRSVSPVPLLPRPPTYYVDTTDIFTAPPISSTSKKRKRICKLCENSDCTGSVRRELCIYKCGQCLEDNCTGRHVKQPLINKKKFKQPYPCTKQSQ